MSETSPAVHFISTNEAFAQVVERLCSQPRVGLDTEFLRTDTYYAKAALIQLTDGHDVYLVDPLEIQNWDALGRLLSNPDVEKIFHSGEEDVALLARLTEALWANTYDTQIAANYSITSSSIGYANLVKLVFDEQLSKDATRSDWMQRPLREHQLAYAVEDVIYLLPLRERLDDLVEEKGHAHAAHTDMERLPALVRAQLDPETAWERIKTPRSFPACRYPMLQALAAWRERTAAAVDLPKNWVVKDRQLVQICERAPGERSDLESATDLSRAALRRHACSILEISNQTRRSAHDESRYQEAAARARSGLRQAVGNLAAELGVQAELLASKRNIDKLLRRITIGAVPHCPIELTGWRAEALAGAIDEAVEPLAAAARQLGLIAEHRPG
jgi:ribonuclease D